MYNIAIVGGGIIGCAIARQLANRFDKIILLEKETSVGTHTSGRNSGVVHSGFNPTPGTLKAALCVEGAGDIREFCKEHKVRCYQVGTYVVAVEEGELPLLYELKIRGEKNGVHGLEILPIETVQQREPNVKGLAALFSPTGAIVDSRALTTAIADDAVNLGVEIALEQQVTRMRENESGVLVATLAKNYLARLVINCAGLHADRLAHMMGVGKDYIIAPFRGEYFVVNTAGRPLIHSMIYAVPNPIVPFLGVHLTRTVDGHVLIGPNAVPAFGREAYRRTAVNVRDIAEIITHRGFWNAFLQNRELIRIAWNELRHSCSKRHFLREASRLVKGPRLEDLRLGSRVGIRPQLIKSDGRLVEDLVIETTSRSIHLLNAVSPGMTSALAFARWLAGRISDDLSWTNSTDRAPVVCC